MKNSPKDKNSKDKRCNCNLTKNCASILLREDNGNRFPSKDI